MTIKMFFDKDEVKPLLIRAFKDGSGLRFDSVDRDGITTWNLFRLDAKTGLTLYSAIGEDTGLPLDKNGHIRVGSDDDLLLPQSQTNSL
jgi:hypothetical protein